MSALHPTKGILGVGSVLIVDGDEVRCVGYPEMGKVGVAGKNGNFRRVCFWISLGKNSAGERNWGDAY